VARQARGSLGGCWTTVGGSASRGTARGLRRMCASCDVCSCVVTRSPARRSYDRPIARRRSYGTGSLFIRRTASGQETWCAQFWAGGRQIKRALGKKRATGTTDGLTRAQAEAALRRLVEETAVAPPPAERIAVA